MVQLVAGPTQEAIDELMDAIGMVIEAHRRAKKAPTKEHATAVQQALEALEDVWYKYPAAAAVVAMLQGQARD